MSLCPFSRLVSPRVGDSQSQQATCPIPHGERAKWLNGDHAALAAELISSKDAAANGITSSPAELKGEDLPNSIAVEAAVTNEQSTDSEQHIGISEASNRQGEAKCPFGYGSAAKQKAEPSSANEDRKGVPSEDANGRQGGAKCPFGQGSVSASASSAETEGGSSMEPNLAAESGDTNTERKAEGKCPFGFDSGTFKIGPLSCVICKGLLFDTCRVVPCRHIYCRGCVSRFKDCPICGADIENLEPDADLQSMVDRYIDGHGRIHRPKVENRTEGGQKSANDLAALDTRVYEEEGSVERGGFLLQQAMRAFQAGNLASAKHRLDICLADTREELERTDGSARLRAVACQLGAILGLLGDCCRLLGESDTAERHYASSADLLERVEEKDAEVVHALSVSLNKQGDLRYYAGDLPAARAFYCRALEVRRKAVGEKGPQPNPSQVLDLAVSLAKLADVDRSLGDEVAAREGFSQAAQTAETAVIPEGPLHEALASRRASTLEFIRSQMQS